MVTRDYKQITYSYTIADLFLEVQKESALRARRIPKVKDEEIPYDSILVTNDEELEFIDALDLCLSSVEGLFKSFGIAVNQFTPIYERSETECTLTTVDRISVSYATLKQADAEIQRFIRFHVTQYLQGVMNKNVFIDLTTIIASIWSKIINLAYYLTIENMIEPRYVAGGFASGIVEWSYEGVTKTDTTLEYGRPVTIEQINVACSLDSEGNTPYSIKVTGPGFNSSIEVPYNNGVLVCNNANTQIVTHTTNDPEVHTWTINATDKEGNSLTPMVVELQRLPYVFMGTINVGESLSGNGTTSEIPFQLQSAVILSELPTVFNQIVPDNEVFVLAYPYSWGAKEFVNNLNWPIQGTYKGSFMVTTPIQAENNINGQLYAFVQTDWAGQDVENYTLTAKN